jgi:hypothetical protein
VIGQGLIEAVAGVLPHAQAIGSQPPSAPPAIEIILRHQCLKGHKARTIKVAGLDRTEHGGEAL